MPFGFLNSYWHFNIETGFMCCCNVEFSFQKFVENNSISAKSDAQITILGINKDWVGWRKSALFPITHWHWYFFYTEQKKKVSTFVIATIS